MIRAVKRLLRIGLWALAGLAVLVVATGILCLDGVDYRPYFREAYYAKTIAQLRASAETNQLARGELAAGFGRAKLSPTVNAAQDAPEQGQFRSLPMAGYGARHGKPATGTHDDLYIKAVALAGAGQDWRDGGGRRLDHPPGSGRHGRAAPGEGIGLDP